LQEKVKATSAKAKKLDKTVKDVCILPLWDGIDSWAFQQDEKAKQDALRTIEESIAKAKNQKKKLAEHEVEQEREERVLEEIRDSLKDKTAVFHSQIEAKQKELQPWTGKINAKQAELDVATSERDALVMKADTLKTELQEATRAEQQAETDLQEKVSFQRWYRLHAC
jgi:structural maintenance of chromosome 4